jgi:TetR/AcrR family transcriptional repressor of nem operon
MARASLKEKILTHGLSVVHERGYAASSVRDIVAAAGVPQGSFTNHFASKEAFGLELVNLYYSDIQRFMDETLMNDAIPPMERLRLWAEGGVDALNQNGRWNGCLLGNFGAEANVEVGSIQERLAEIFREERSKIEYCLRAAVAAGDLPAETDCEKLASFIHAAFEGAILMAKAERSLLPTESFKEMLFSMLLRKKG